MTPEIRRARSEVQRARRKGLLEQRPCQLCGRNDVDAHHEDYSKPLQIVWLCRRHHVWLHQEGRNAERVRELHREAAA